MTIKGVAVVAGVVAGGIGATLMYGDRRWRSETSAAVARLDHGTRASAVYDPRELEGLPPPVARYFRAVLKPGLPLVTRASAEWSGEFRVGAGDRTWRPFTATQVWVVRPSGFVWDATIRLAPAVPARVRDGFVARRGSMRGALYGLVPIVDAHDRTELDAGGLQRYLGEAAWFPTALLPSQGVTWTALTETSARATLTEGRTTVSLDFSFDGAGLPETIFTPARFREVEGAFVATPWRARVGEYVERGGMLVPLEGEVEWVVDGQPLPYWRGRVTSLRFQK